MKSLLIILISVFSMLKLFGQHTGPKILTLEIANGNLNLSSWAEDFNEKFFFAYFKTNRNFRPISKVKIIELSSQKICVEVLDQNKVDPTRITNWFISKVNNTESTIRFERISKRFKTNCDLIQENVTSSVNNKNYESVPTQIELDINELGTQCENLKNYQMMTLAKLNLNLPRAKSKFDLIEKKYGADIASTNNFKQLKSLIDEAEIKRKDLVEYSRLKNEIFTKSDSKSFVSQTEIDEVLTCYKEFSKRTKVIDKSSTDFKKLNYKIRVLEDKPGDFIKSSSSQVDSESESINAPSIEYEKNSDEVTSKEKTKNPPKSTGKPTSTNNIGLSEISRELYKDAPKIWLGNGVFIDFIRIHNSGKNEFLFGITNNQYLKLLAEELGDGVTFDNEIIEDEKRVIKTPPSYFIGKYEVTNEQFKAIVEKHKFKKGEEKFPVTNISIQDLFTFIDNLQLRIGLNSGFKIDLPTEIEWEYAAKGDYDSRYPWGSKMKYGQANIESDKLQKVGSFEETTWCGVYDMIGNATELCYLEKEYYSFEPSSADKFSGRGGSFQSSAYSARVSTRHIIANIEDNHIGFRIVLRQN